MTPAEHDVEEIRMMELLCTQNIGKYEVLYDYTIDTHT